ncbi:hypothetical protein V8G54_005295 [Vigna mungo]|uniref:Uncharacterized protein n=1 Tax=Vigna mungo TaxID=3915 RepID=A0AAQ3S6A2_VIGMU
MDKNSGDKKNTNCQHVCYLLHAMNLINGHKMSLLFFHKTYIKIIRGRKKNDREEKEGEGKINYSNPCDLISVVKMRSLSVKHNFSTSFIEPKTCTRDITLGCIPKLTKKDPVINTGTTRNLEKKLLTLNNIQL